MLTISLPVTAIDAFASIHSRKLTDDLIARHRAEIAAENAEDEHTNTGAQHGQG